MKTISLVTYIKRYIEDEYAMGVFYNCIKKLFVDNDFSLFELSSFYIDGRYLGEDINVTFRPNKYKNNRYSLSLLLSVRLLMLNPKYVNLCSDEDLIFMPRPTESFLWIGYMSIILANMKDGEINMLYSMLESIFYHDCFSYEEKEKFRESIVVLEYKNEKTYYNSIARETNGPANGVIGNCSFFEQDITRYVVPQDIKYVGDTAFSFCDKLETLVFENKVFFGVFPIIECPKLRQIVVPTDLIGYYKESLPYYANIICDKESAFLPEIINDNMLESNKESTIGCLEATYKSIDNKKLEEVFENRVTSYKFFWFLAIISLIKEKGNLHVSHEDIIVRIAAMAWPIVFKYEINLGSVDMIKNHLNDIIFNTSITKVASSTNVENYLLRNYSFHKINRFLTPLLKNVPYRFLSPWITFTTNEDVIEKSRAKNFDGMYALYPNHIEFNDDWWKYINTNYDQVCNFAILSFKNYLRQYNSDLKLLPIMTNKWPLINGK